MTDRAKKISGFDSSTTPTDNDVLLGVQSNVTKRFTFATLKAWLSGLYTSLTSFYAHVANFDAHVVTFDAHVANTTVHFTEGSIDHGSISGLGDDDHPQYHTDARGDARYEGIGAVAAHVAAGDPHTQYATDSVVNAHTGDSSIHFEDAASDGSTYGRKNGAWAAALTNPMTTAEDMIVGGASGVPGRLAVGADGEELRAVGGAVAWAAREGMVHVGQFTGSAVNNMDFTDLEAGHDYIFDIATDTLSTNSLIAARVSTDNGSTFIASASAYYSGGLNVGTSPSGHSNGFTIMHVEGMNHTDSGHAEVHLKNANDASFETVMYSRNLFNSNFPGITTNCRQAGEANDAIRFYRSASATCNWTINVWKVKQP